MYRYLLSSILSASLLFSVNSFAQKCSFEKDEVDPFTKEQTRVSKFIRLSDTPRWWAKLEQSGKKYGGILNVSMMKEVKAGIPKGTKIMVKLEDGTLLDLATSEDVTPTFNVEMQRYIVTQWNLHFDLTEDVLKKMNASPVELMRIKIGADDCNMPDAHGKGCKQLMEMAGCLLNKN